MTEICPITRQVCLVRKYTDSYGRFVSYLQGKIIEVGGEFVCFRDVQGNKSRLFRDNTWNLDHIVFDWLKIHGVEKLYYYERKFGKLFRTTIRTIAGALKRKEAYKEKLNNHTQIFIPRYLWAVNPKEKSDVLRASHKWIKEEIDVSWMDSTFERLEADRNPVTYIHPAAKERLSEIWKRKVLAV